MEAHYPAHWEADVVLADGGTAHVRPIRPADADRLRAFYSRLSAESIYFRYFGPRPKLSDREVAFFTNVDYVDRVALIATIGTEMVAVVRYDRTAPGEAEVAFLVEDAHQGRGVASVMLEHLAATARERGIETFIADVLPANMKMMGVLRQVGYTAQSRFADGVVRMTLDLTPTETSDEVTASREHRAEARSIARLLTPGSVAVIGASREPGGVGQTVLRNLLAADFTGPVYPVHREVRAVAGVRAYPSVKDIDGEVDLAVLAVPADSVIDVVKECAEKGVRGLVVVSSGFGETGPKGRGAPGRARPHRPRVRPARGRPQLPRHRQHRPGRTAERHARGDRPRQGQGRLLQPVGRPRHRAAAARRPARHRHLQLRLGGQQGRRVGQRPPAVLGGGRGHRGHPALPGVAG
ncbi:hypothetical protein GCM10020219_048730 [Nonomuraea dietziae]